MATRAVYTFVDGDDSFAVYKHWDGNPEHAAEFIMNAFAYAWELPRFEASDFAAAFVAGNKHSGGGDVRLTDNYSTHLDLDYDYVISQAPNRELIVRVFEHICADRKQIYYGRLKDFVDQYGSEYAIAKRKTWLPRKQEAA